VNTQSKPRLIRFNEVIKRTSKSRAAIYVQMNGGEFPKPVRLGPKSVAFVESEINEWIEARLASRVKETHKRSIRGVDYE
jgi:prophage regulatory protein